MDAAYTAFVHGVQLSISATKLYHIATAIANYLPRIDTAHQRRWRAIKESVDRNLLRNIDEGVSGTSVQIGIDDLEKVEDLDLTAGGDKGDHPERRESRNEHPTEAASPVRRSSRKSRKAEKARRTSDFESSASESGEEAGDIRRGRPHQDVDKGNEGSEGPYEKKKDAYLPYDPKIHFFWAETVRRITFAPFLLFSD